MTIHNVSYRSERNGLMDGWTVCNTYNMASHEVFVIRRKAIMQIAYDCYKQVAHLWQKDRATLASFSINVQLYSQNHKIAFLSHHMMASEAI